MEKEDWREREKEEIEERGREIVGNEAECERTRESYVELGEWNITRENGKDGEI